MDNRLWLHRKNIELWFICLPSFICVLILFLFPHIFSKHQEVSTTWWIALVLVIDVGHVYSTLYRTYFDKQQWLLHKPWLIGIPLLSFSIALLFYLLGDGLFWRMMAYTAVFHFIRQQYGFVKVYQRDESEGIRSKSAVIAVYAATLYPLLYWHCYGPFEFSWFTKNDFLFGGSPQIERWGRGIFILILLCYGLEVLYIRWKHKHFNLPAFLIVSGTALNWFMGIVWFKSDLTFTLLNVVGHGIPYMALVWLFNDKNKMDVRRARFSFQRFFTKPYGTLLFFAIPILFGFFEEGFWDALVWKDHPAVFSMFYSMGHYIQANAQYVMVPLLITPQLTHYILDGFIWKISKGHLER